MWFEVAGETALDVGDSIGSVFADLGRIALAIMLVTLVLLALFLRSLLAPVYLLAASVLAVFATLGLTILIGQHILGYGSLVYFVPFAAGVLLVRSARTTTCSWSGGSGRKRGAGR